METTIAYEVFYYFEGIYFWRPANFESLILEIYSKYNLISNLLNIALFTLWFYNFIKKWAKEMKKMIPVWGKETEEKRKSATIMIFIDGKGTVFFQRSWNYKGNHLYKNIRK